MHQLLFITVTLLLASVVSYAWGRPAKITLVVPNGGRWGEWGPKEMCPHGFYAAGFSLKVHNKVAGDNTGLNGIRLHCVDTPKGKSHATVTSSTGCWGTWTETKWCDSGMLMNFHLKVQRPLGDGDDTAANNIEFQCSGDSKVITGDGTPWGDWGGWSMWCIGKGICGIQTKIEEPQGSGDDTTMNDVHLFCCD